MSLSPWRVASTSRPTNGMSGPPFRVVRAVDADADGRTDLLADAFDIGVVLYRNKVTGSGRA